jgi:hypothetical protein
MQRPPSPLARTLALASDTAGGYTLPIGAAQAAWSPDVREVHLQRMPE